MKQIHFFVTCCITILAISCSQFEDELFVPTIDQTAGQGRLNTFTAASELTNTEGTRTGIDENHLSIWSSNEELSIIRFDAKDKAPVLVNCFSHENSPTKKGQPITFSCYTNSNDNTSDNFIYREGGEQYAIYPQLTNAEPVDFAGGAANTRKFKIDLPEQRLKIGTDFQYPMLIGRWDENNQMFLFKNPFATVKLNVKAPAGEIYHLRHITITGGNMEHMWGKATVTTGNSGESSISFDNADEATYYASMNCMQLDSEFAESRSQQQGYAVTEEGSTFYISIPAQEYARGLNISLICDEGVMDQTLKTGGITVSANQLLSTPELTMDVDDSGIYTAMLRCTDSTIGVAWTTLATNAPYLNQILPEEGTHDYSAEKTNDYTVALYSDAACSNLVVSWDIIDNKYYSSQTGSAGTLFNNVTYPQRFIFSGLTPSTTYYFTVTATTAEGTATSRPRAVSTAAKAFNGTVTTSGATAGNTILFENFENCVMGGDITTRSPGYSSYVRNTYTTVADSTPLGEQTPDADGRYDEFYICTAGTEMGLFNTLHNQISDMGLEDWSWYDEDSAGGCILSRAGYLKLGTANNRAAIVTPALTALGNNIATITVKFKACPYGGETHDAAEDNIAVRLLDDGTVSTTSPYNKLTGYTVTASEPITLEGNQTTWQEYEVTFAGASQTSRIAIGFNREEANSANRFMVDDIQITVDSIDGVSAALVRATDTTIAVGWTITKENIPYIGIPNIKSVETALDFSTDITKTWEVGIYSDAACTQAVQVLQNLKNDQDGNALYTGYANGTVPRFTFNGLTPDTQYYVMIKNTTDGKQMGSPLEVRTEASAADVSELVEGDGTAEAGDLIIFQNFGRLSGFADASANSAGYYLGGHSTALGQPFITGTVICGQNFQERKVNANGAASSGAGLFSSWEQCVESCGIRGWGWYGDGASASGSSIGLQSGCVKIGTTDNTSTLYTPKLSALPGAATVRVTFRAAPYRTPKTPISSEARGFKVSALDGASIEAFDGTTSGSSFKVTGGTVIASQTFEFDADQTNTDWREYSVDLVDVTPTTRIGIGGNSEQTTNRLLVDDIRVEVLSISNGIWTGLVRATDTTLNLGWTITQSNTTNNYFTSLFPNDPAKNALDHNGYDRENYTIYLYKDADCTDLELQLDLGGAFFREGSEGAYSYFPCRYTFSGLEPETTYYFRVKDKLTGKISDPVGYSTEPMDYNGTLVTSGGSAAVGDVLVFQNFGHCLYTGDFANYGAGYTRSNLSAANVNHKASGVVSWSAQNDVIDNGYPLDFGRCDANTESGLFSTCNGLLDDMELEDWGYTSTDSLSRVFIKPGYLKIGGSSQLASIVTPELKGLSTSTLSSVRVTFKACKLSTQNYNNSVNEDYVIVRGITDSEMIPHDDAVNTSMRGYVYGGYDSDAAEVTLDSALGEWKEYSVTLTGVSGDTRIAIGGNRPTAGNSRFFIDDVKVTVTQTGLQYITGKVSYSGSGVAGVAVTDGYTTVLTNSSGIYKIPYSKTPEYIYYSTPHNHEIGRNGTGLPHQYLPFESGKYSGYNFTLGAKMNSSTHLNYNDAEDKLGNWYLFVMADPQTHDNQEDNCYNRFVTNVVPDIRAQVDRGYNSACDSSSGKNQAYGVLLGDIVWDSTRDAYHSTMKAKLEVGDTGVYWFACPGNHDYHYTNRSITGYKSVYGPTRHSFNRGDVHVVCMNNVQYTSNSSYEGGFSEDEFNWLRSDLAAVSKDKCVVLCCHIQFFGGGSGQHLKSRYYYETLQELSKFANAYIFTGHRHAHRSYYHKNYGVFEVNHPSACGQFWNVKACSDGSPAGYTIYTFKGNDILHQRYKAIGTSGSADVNSTLAGNNYIENGLRVYWAAGQIHDTSNQIHRYTWGHSNKNVIIANVFMAHEEGGPAGTIAGNWKVQISENSGSTWKDMDLVDTTFFRHSVPDGLEGWTGNNNNFNYKTYIVDADGNTMNSANFTTAAGVRGDIDWWYWGKVLEKNNNSIKSRSFSGSDVGNLWNYANVSPHIFRAFVSTSYASQTAVDNAIKAGTLQIKATSPTGITYKADKLTFFSKTDDTGLEWND